MTTHYQGEVKDLSLAPRGKERIEWAARDMPVLCLIRERFQRDMPFSGIRITICLHITTETANLALTLQAGGAQIVMCASNPLSTQDDVAAALVEYYRIPVFGIRGENDETYYEHIHAALDHHPHIVMDDGCDLVSILHTTRTELLADILGGSEETTTGVIRLRSMHDQGILTFPVVAVNDSQTKHMFDNRYGTGQSSLDAVIRATNILLAGRTVVVSGYGWCGRGIAARARGMGSTVIVCEVEPVRALEAVMDGYRVLPALEAASLGDVFITATGDIHVIDAAHLEKMKDGAILANAGHFNVEINVSALEQFATSSRRLREHITEYTLPDKRKVYLLSEGRLVNLSAAEGHPASVMDMSFANQALAVEYILKNARSLSAGSYTLPVHLDTEIARLKLQSMGIQHDTLTAEQTCYLSSWKSGT